MRVEGAGPEQADIVLLGEAPGANELLYGKPFVGAAGQELDRMLRDAGLDRKSLYVTNVFKTHPPGNDVLHFFTSRADPGAALDLPAYSPGKFLRLEHLPMVEGVFDEFSRVGAKLVVAFGKTALWALLGHQKITAHVGNLYPPENGRSFWVLPTYHPAAVLRDWSLRTTIVANLKKARGFRESSTSSRHKVSGGTVKTNPTLPEVVAFAERAFEAPLMAVDVETAHSQIRTISFSLTPTSAFVIPFWEPPADSYWPSTKCEVEAWKAVRRALSGPGRKVFHNGAYDLHYLSRVHGIPTNGPIDDTLIAHHALEPELPRSLGFLAATYLNIPEWKTMRLKSEKEEE